jgi:hypothetical protein
MTTDTSRALSLMTPEEHRRLAAAYRRELPNHPETEFLAEQHERVAAALEMRDAEPLITPEMIEAGAEVLRECAAECFGGEYRETMGKDELAELVYRAMASVAPVAGPQNDERPPAKT